ncbi:MAG: type II secretion system F family protein [Bdellovibrionaceae bacterium]|nr:type II secretion system F family protein [Pseudobdellovibrionaceae bacterium]
MLDRAILSMKSGRSLRISLREAARESPPFLSRLLHNIIDRLEHGAASGKSSGLAAEIARELRRAELRGGRMLESMESFRRDLRLRADFRHKSGQLTLQTRAQAILALLLYLPLLGIQIRSGHLLAARTLVSVALFFGAQLCIHLTARSFKWKV